MINSGYRVLVIFLYLGLACFYFGSPVKAWEYRDGVSLKSFDLPGRLEQNFYQNNSEKMTKLRDIKLLGEKNEIEEMINLRVAELFKENKETQCYYYYNIARAYEEQGNYSKALENYKTAIGPDCKCNPAYLNIGLIYAKIGRYDNSKENFLKYIEFCDNSEEKKLIGEFIEKMKSLANK